MYSYMPDPSDTHHRRSIRLNGFDYTQPGAYFVTICTHLHACVLGEVVNEVMQLSRFGQIAFDFWEAVTAHFSSVEIDAFVIMPNHIHAIIVLHDPAVGAVSPRPTGSPNPGFPGLGQIVGFYKYQTTKQINVLRGNAGTSFWQRNYYEHIIRNESEWGKIRDYILTNPFRWEKDDLYPGA
jgi:putative transposase